MEVGDNLKCALELVTNLKRSNSLEAIAGRSAEENKKKVPDAFKDLIAIDNDRVCVIKGKLTHHKCGPRRRCLHAKI